MPLLNRVHTTTFTNFQPPARCSAPVFSLFSTPVMSRTFLRKLESQRDRKQRKRLQTRLVLSSRMVQSFSGKPENYPTMQMRRHPSCIHPRTANISVAKLFHSLSPPPMYDSLFLFLSFFLPPLTTAVVWVCSLLPRCLEQATKYLHSRMCGPHT